MSDDTREAWAFAADHVDTSDPAAERPAEASPRDMVLTILGCGYSGRAIGERLSRAGADVVGTTRDPGNKGEALRVRGIAPLAFGGEAPSDALEARLSETTHLVVSIAPGEAGDPAIAMHAEAIKRAPRLAWIGYLSTVGVYGDHDGAWVDEDAVTHPVSERSRERVAAENLWMTLALERGVPISLLRLSGIYGPGRNAFVSLHEGRARRLVKPGQVFNRIHRDDIAGASEHLATRLHNGIVNVTDDEPAPPQDVVEHAARLMGVEPPPEQDFATAELSPMARSFYGETKRVSNARLKALGYAMRHPTYREGLAALWDGGWREE